VASIFKLSNQSVATGLQAHYDDMLAGNPFFNPWAPAPSYDSIATVTVGSGGSSSISFTSIPSTYTHLQIRGIGRLTNAVSSNDASLRFNTDSGSNYAHHHLYGNGASASTPGTGSTTSSILVSYGGFPGTNTTTTAFSGFVIDILDYASTSKNKTVRGLIGYDANGSGELSLFSGLWFNSTIAGIFQIDFSGVTFAQYSQFALYGVK
jgi:hypothetical protein